MTYQVPPREWRGRSDERGVESDATPIWRLRSEPYLLLLSTYIHEQSHWVVDGAPAIDAAVAELEARFPDLPVGYPDGASDRRSSYVHLGVNALEYHGLRRLVGELRARQVVEFWATDHYRTLYRAVLDHSAEILAIFKRHGIVPPRAAAGATVSAAARPGPRRPAPDLRARSADRTA